MKTNYSKTAKSTLKHITPIKQKTSIKSKKTTLPKKNLHNTMYNSFRKNYTSSTAKKPSRTQNPKLKNIRKISNFEDISTYYKENENCKIEYEIPPLITIETETESEFINIKLGEPDSKFDESIRDFKEKNNKNNDSREIFDFTNKTHVDYVMNNLSILSESHSFKESSDIFDECNNDETSGKSKVINKIRIFNTKQNIQNFNTFYKF